jgi:hypothetical protein
MKQEFDFLGKFIERHCIQHVRATSQQSTFHIAYIIWFKDRFPTKILPTCDEIKEERKLHAQPELIRELT